MRLSRFIAKIRAWQDEALTWLGTSLCHCPCVCCACAVLTQIHLSHLGVMTSGSGEVTLERSDSPGSPEGSFALCEVGQHADIVDRLQRFITKYDSFHLQATGPSLTPQSSHRLLNHRSAAHLPICPTLKQCSSR